MSSLPQLLDNKIAIRRVPAIKEWVDQPDYYVEDVNTRPSKKKAVQSKFQKTVPKKKKGELRTPTYLTPTVARITDKYFEGALEVAQSILYHADDELGTVRRKGHKAHFSNPKKIIWGDRLVGDEDVYKSITVDGTRYSVCISRPSLL